MTKITRDDRTYELLNAVFEVPDAYDWGERISLCVVFYIRLVLPATREGAIKILTDKANAKYKTDKSRFVFWCDSSVTDCGSPQEISMEVRK